MLIRQLTVADATEWWYLRISAAHDCARAAPRKPGGWSLGDLKTIRLHLASPGVRVLGAFDDGGALMAVVSLSPRGTALEGEGWLYDLYVMPAWRRRGLGRRLVALAIALHEEDETLRSIRVHALREQHAALMLYRSIGFFDAAPAEEIGDETVDLRYELRVRR